MIPFRHESRPGRRAISFNRLNSRKLAAPATDGPGPKTYEIDLRPRNPYLECRNAGRNFAPAVCRDGRRRRRARAGRRADPVAWRANRGLDAGASDVADAVACDGDGDGVRSTSAVRAW